MSQIKNAHDHYYKVRNAINRMVTETTGRLRNQELPKSIPLNELEKLEKDDRDIPSNIPEELKEALNSITTTIEQKLNDFFPFKGKIIPIGSTIDGTKTGQPDEFDYLYVVNHDSVKHLGEEIFRKCSHKPIKASEITAQFTDKVDDIASKLDLKNLSVSHGGFASPSYSGCRMNGPATTLLFYSGNILISLDFTMAIPLSKEKETEILKVIASKAGPLIEYLNKKPEYRNKRFEFLKDNLCLVAVNPDKDEWRVSTARLEATLLADLPKDHCLKIAMRYGKILSKKQISAIQSGDPDNVNILTDLGPINAVVESLSQLKHKEKPDLLKSKIDLLKKQMRYNHIYLDHSEGKKFNELTSSILKLDSASIKHIAFRTVCQDRSDLAAAKGEESAKVILTCILKELSNHKVYTVNNFLYEHKIKMVSIAGFVASHWFDLTCLAKVRCEQFLTSNRLAPELQRQISMGESTSRKSLQICTKCHGLCSRCHQYQQDLLQLYQSSQDSTQKAEQMALPDEQMELPDAYISGRDSNTTDIALCETNTSLDESQYSGDDPLERGAQLAAATQQSRVPISEVPVGVEEAVSRRTSIPDYEAARLSQKIHAKDIGVGNIYPRGIASCPKTGNVAVTCHENDCIYLLSPDLQKIRKFGEQGSGDNQYDTPCGITFSASGDMFITDYSNHRVQHVSPEGIFIKSFGSEGHGDGEFYFPVGICWAAGLLYVGGNRHYRIQVFQDTGKYITSICREYFSSEQSSIRHISVSVEHDTVAVSDNLGKLRLFSLKGQLKETFEDGDLIHDAKGVDIDRLGQIVVADRRGVVVLGQDRKLITRINKPEGRWYPGDITITLTGDIIISDFSGERLIKYDVPHKTV